MFEVIGRENYGDGDIIFEEYTTGDAIYQVETGAVTITKKVYGENIVVEVIRKGEIFGEMSYIARIPRTATAKALGATVVNILDPGAVRKEFISLSPGMRQIFQSLVLRLKKATETSSGVHFLRKDSRIPKVFSLSFLADDTVRESYSHDASCGGLFIKTQRPLDRGREFELTLWLPNDDKPLKIDCQVMWNRLKTDDPIALPLGMGVRFKHICRKDYEKLHVALPDC
ncbi:MAG: cyclic nucleotide-binding domain-containing protein [Desulfatibacillum sp.]|nr:cyclic nucleotide-binding domain-containing protein [Desulfatibacillum sp.]